MGQGGPKRRYKWGPPPRRGWKSLRAAKQECKELASKLITEEKERISAETRLKNAQVQAEDQRKLLYQIEIELATQRQLVLELKSELQKAKEAS